MFVYECANTYVHVCACMQERDRAGQSSHYCSAILKVIADKLCLENDECPASPIAFLFIFVLFSLYQQMKSQC